jgi:hypothetical protein
MTPFDVQAANARGAIVLDMRSRAPDTGSRAMSRAG